MSRLQAVQYSTHVAGHQISHGAVWQLAIFLAGVVLLIIGVRRTIRLRFVPWSLILGIVVIGMFFAFTAL